MTVLNLLYDIPAVVLLVLAVVVLVAAAGAGQLFVHAEFRRRDFIAHNEVGGIIITVAGTLFAVVLGFLTVVVWQHYQEARALVVLESDADIDVWHTSVGLPAALRDRVRNDIVGYANIMVVKEWPLMKHGAYDATAAMVSMDAIDAVGEFLPANMGQSNAQVATLQELGVLHDARQQRLAANDSGVSGFEWLVLSIGAVCIVCFCWLFGLNNRFMQVLMTSTVVTIIVSILVLLFELQYPFRSDVGIGPDAWKGAIEHIHQMQTGPMPNMRM
jgi:hypothetical protein